MLDLLSLITNHKSISNYGSKTQLLQLLFCIIGNISDTIFKNPIYRNAAVSKAAEILAIF